LWNWDSTHILAKGPWYLRSKLWGLKFNIDCNGKAFKNWFLLRTRIGNEICAIVKLLDHCDMQIFTSLPECRLQGLARKMLIGSTAEKKEKKVLRLKCMMDINIDIVIYDIVYYWTDNHYLYSIVLCYWTFFFIQNVFGYSIHPRMAPLQLYAWVTNSNRI
jgi:hypothetical protein